MDHPPNIPLVTGGVKKHAQKESVTQAISGAICEGSCLSQCITAKASTALCCCLWYWCVSL